MKDQLEILVLKLLIIFIIAVVGIYFLSPVLSIFNGMPRTGSILGDTFMFAIIPLCAVFFLVYRIFKVFSA